MKEYNIDLGPRKAVRTARPRLSFGLGFEMRSHSLGLIVSGWRAGIRAAKAVGASAWYGVVDGRMGQTGGPSRSRAGARDEPPGAGVDGPGHDPTAIPTPISDGPGPAPRSVDTRPDGCTVEVISPLAQAARRLQSGGMTIPINRCKLQTRVQIPSSPPES